MGERCRTSSAHWLRRVRLAAAWSLAGVIAASAEAAADSFTFSPTVGLDEGVTDNAFSTEEHKVLDSVTTTSLHFTTKGRTRHLTLDGEGRVGYNKYLVSPQLDGFAVDMSGSGSATLIDRFLTLDAVGAISDQPINRITIPATERTTALNTSRISIYEAGPTITTKIGHFADVKLQARYAEVNAGNPSSTPLPQGLSSSSILQGVGIISTSPGIRPYAMTVTGEYFKQNQGFAEYNGLYSLFLGPPQGLRAIGRVGYESVFDPGITDISGLIWSAGGIWNSDKTGSVRVEYGQRYHEPTWSGSLSLALTPLLSLSGDYSKALETEQARLRRTLTQILEPVSGFPVSTPVTPQNISLGLINATALNEDFSLGLIWQIQPISPRRAVRSDDPYNLIGTRLELTGGFSKRLVLVTAEKEHFMFITLHYQQNLSRRLSFEMRTRAEKALATQPGDLQDLFVNTEWDLYYALNRQLDAAVTYVWQKNYLSNGGAIPENFISFGIRQRF
jgi:uncharacterized protein (PEP-CTERM system associated)